MLDQRSLSYHGRANGDDDLPGGALVATEAETRRVYRVKHRTTYVYGAPVAHAHHLAHLRPRQMPFQDVRRALIELRPGPLEQHQEQDYFGNQCDSFEILAPHKDFEIVATSEVELSVREGMVGVGVSEEEQAVCSSVPVGASWEMVARLVHQELALLPVAEFCFDSPLVRSHPMLRSYAEPVFSPGRPLHDALLELNQRIHDDFRYEPLSTDVSTPLARVMRERRGVCQDFAHVMVGCLRSLGLPARYVSGYLETVPPPGQQRMVGSDASHAWIAAFVPEIGWLDLDPTNACSPELAHVTVAYGRDFSDVSPLKGVVLGGGSHRVNVGVDVQRVER